MNQDRRKNGHWKPNGTPRQPSTRGKPEDTPYAQGEQTLSQPVCSERSDHQADSESSDLPPLDLARAWTGRRILITGATGFVGKVVLSMLLHRFPSVGRVFVLVRPGAGGTAEARFFDKIAPSRPFDPLRLQHGDAFDRFMREKCLPLAGDVSTPLLGLSDEDLQRLEGLDLVLNVAGLVDFNPSLELALSVNVEGPRHAVALCERTGAALVQVSTCFVAGNRDGVVFEEEEIRGFFPRREGVSGWLKQKSLDPRDFDLEAEIADCRRHIVYTRESAEDRTRLSEFRRRAIERLRAEGRDCTKDKALRVAIVREKRFWISQRLVELGMERARHWGWQNTYTFTKSLGEQLVAASRCRWAIARPSITESALRYPFPGWNEGFTTSAPLAFLALKGHRSYPGAEKAVLDIVPVDLVAAGLIAIGAELLSEGAREQSDGRVYHLASGDVNPFWVRRCIELLGIYQHRFFRHREEGSKVLNRLLSHLEPYPVSWSHYQTFSAPALARLTRAAGRFIREQTPTWGVPRLSALAGQVADKLDEIQSQLDRTRALFDLYMPFIWDNHHVFHCANIRELGARLTPADRERLPWDPERIDWRSYWLDIHMKGMEQWVFPNLEKGPRKRKRPVKAPRDVPESSPVEDTRSTETQPSSSKRETMHEIDVPAPVAALGRRFLRVAQQILYRRLFATQVRGLSCVPRDRNFLVVANHASHLDMGLVKVALGEAGEKLCAMAAADYFFDTPLKRAYFGNFTNLIPMERTGSVRRSLYAAKEALRQGFNLLIFPEGTRSRDGTMASFKPTAGYLALTSGVDVLPLYLRGTHRALPKGSVWPRPTQLEVIIGRPLSVDELRRRTASLPRGEAHKRATHIMEEAVRRLGEVTAGNAGVADTDSAATGTAVASGTEPEPGAAPATRAGTVDGSATAAGSATGSAAATGSLDFTDDSDSSLLLAQKDDT